MKCKGEIRTVADLTRGLKLAADGPYPGAMDVSGAMAWLRANLLPEEGERYRQAHRSPCRGGYAVVLVFAHPNDVGRKVKAERLDDQYQRQQKE